MEIILYIISSHAFFGHFHSIRLKVKGLCQRLPIHNLLIFLHEGCLTLLTFIKFEGLLEDHEVVIDALLIIWALLDDRGVLFTFFFIFSQVYGLGD